MRSPEDWLEIWMETLKEFTEANYEIIGSDTADKMLRNVTRDLIERILRDGQLDGRVEGMRETLIELESGKAYFDLMKKINQLEELNGPE